MKRIEIALLLILLCASKGLTSGYGRSGSLADPSFRNDGGVIEPFTVIVDTAFPTQVYDSYMTGYTDRSILLQNTNSSFDIFCGTHPYVSATSGPRFRLPPNPDAFSTHGIYDLYCIASPLAGSSLIEILGVITYDTKD